MPRACAPSSTGCSQSSSKRAVLGLPRRPDGLAHADDRQARLGHEVEVALEPLVRLVLVVVGDAVEHVPGQARQPVGRAAGAHSCTLVFPSTSGSFPHPDVPDSHTRPGGRMHDCGCRAVVVNRLFRYPERMAAPARAPTALRPGGPRGASRDRRPAWRCVASPAWTSPRRPSPARACTRPCARASGARAPTCRPRPPTSPRRSTIGAATAQAPATYSRSSCAKPRARTPASSRRQRGGRQIVLRARCSQAVAVDHASSSSPGRLASSTLPSAVRARAARRRAASGDTAFGRRPSQVAMHTARCRPTRRDARVSPYRPAATASRAPPPGGARSSPAAASRGRRCASRAGSARSRRARAARCRRG